MPSEMHELIITLVDHIAKTHGWNTERTPKTVEGVIPDLRITKRGYQTIHLEVQTKGDGLEEKRAKALQAHAVLLFIDGSEFNKSVPIGDMLMDLHDYFMAAVIEDRPKPKFTTTIKQIYWNQKMEMIKEKGYFWEYKATTDYWNKRLNKLVFPCDGVFLVGSKVNRVKVSEAIKFRTYKVFEHPPPEIPTEKCWALKCFLTCPSGHEQAWGNECPYCTPDDACTNPMDCEWNAHAETVGVK